MTHTPGPWTYRKPSEDIPHVKYWIDGAPDAPKATIGPPVADIKVNGQPLANARLIAAAPVTLKELKKSVQTIEELAELVNHYAKKLGLGKKINVEDWTDSARAAIDKATKG